MANDNAADQEYEQLDPTMKQEIFCYHAFQTTSTGIWSGSNPLDYSFPVLLYQIFIVFTATRVVHAVLHRVALPRVISQLIVSTSPPK